MLEFLPRAPCGPARLILPCSKHLPPAVDSTCHSQPVFQSDFMTVSLLDNTFSSRSYACGDEISKFRTDLRWECCHEANACHSHSHQAGSSCNPPPPQSSSAFNCDSILKSKRQFSSKSCWKRKQQSCIRSFFAAATQAKATKNTLFPSLPINHLQTQIGRAIF